MESQRAQLKAPSLPSKPMVVSVTQKKLYQIKDKNERARAAIPRLNALMEEIQSLVEKPFASAEDARKQLRRLNRLSDCASRISGMSHGLEIWLGGRPQRPVQVDSQSKRKPKRRKKERAQSVHTVGSGKTKKEGSWSSFKHT